MSPQYLLAAAVGAGLLLIYGPTVAAALASDGSTADPLRVSVFAPVAAAWLLWHGRERLRALSPRAWWPGLLLVAAASALWAAGEVAGVNAARQLALIALLSAAVAAVLGPAALRAVALPGSFLLFCVNAYFPLVQPLMRLDALSGAAALRLSGVPVELHDLTIVTPAGRWQVIEACSGIDFVLIYAMSGLLFAAIAFRSPWRRAAFVVASIAAALLANALRTWAIVGIAYARNGNDQDHSIIGWTAFAVVFALLFLIGRRLREADPGSSAAHATAPARAEVRRSAWAAAAVVAIAAIAPGVVAAVERQARVASGGEPCRMEQQTRIQRDGMAWLRTRTRCNGVEGLARALEMAPDALRRGDPQAVLVSGTRRISWSGAEDAFEAATLSKLDSQAGEVIYWYQVGGFTTAGRAGAKWHFAMARLSGRDPTIDVITETPTADR